MVMATPVCELRKMTIASGINASLSVHYVPLSSPWIARHEEANRRE